MAEEREIAIVLEEGGNGEEGVGSF